MKLPKRMELPAQITVCECCQRAGCWLGIEQCFGVKSGSRQRKSMTLTPEEAEGLALESPDNWKPRRRPSDAPRDIEDLRDLIAYQRVVARRRMVTELVELAGIDRTQVEAEMAKLWPEAVHGC